MKRRSSMNFTCLTVFFPFFFPKKQPLKKTKKTQPSKQQADEVCVLFNFSVGSLFYIFMNYN